MNSDAIRYDGTYERDARPKPAAAAWSVAPERYDSPAATALWREYYTEVSDRWFRLHEQRSTPPQELAQGIAGDDGATLLPPHGQLLVARYGGEPAGTAGVRMLDGTTGELKRVYVLERLRGLGGGSVLLAAAEDAALALGARRLILDTRHDLTEARRMYTRHGYRETPPHNDEPYAEHWYAKDLIPGTAG
ncbi:GNAT family N-acetyltransferase [Streptomyces sp. NPDC058045]|uniref:GNAT family N-acetyltransferase n=1 Tax=Streptomyces sp. NPDC058045 TaxID=3346311 RepID=UPI0036E86F5C